MNPRVSSVVTMPNLMLQLEFVDGRRATFDMSSFVRFPVFERFKDPSYFCEAKDDHRTVARLGGIDFDPDTLYLELHSF